MIMSRVLGYLCGIVAAILVLLSIWVISLAPYGNESDDFVAPIAGGVILILSAVALTMNAQVALKVAWFPQPTRLIVHLANIVALLLIVAGVVPWLLTMPILSPQDWALLFLPVLILLSYVHSIRAMR